MNIKYLILTCKLRTFSTFFKRLPWPYFITIVRARYVSNHIRSDVVVFLVGTFALQNHVAGEPVLHDEAELRLVDDVLLGTEVNQQSLGQILLFLVVHWDRGHA